MTDKTNEQALPEWIVQAVARGWCSQENSHKIMDPDLAFAIAAEVSQALASRPADTGERGAVTEAMGHVYAALRSIRYNANNGHQDRPAHIRLRMIADEAEKAINKMDAALTQGGGNGR